MRIKNKIIATFLVALSVFITGVLGVTIYQDLSGSTVELNGNELVLSGQISETIDLTKSEISISASPLTVNMRVSGISDENSLKGKYSVDGVDGQMQCMIMDKSQPYILITCGDARFAVNLKTVDETMELFKKITDVK